MWIAALALAAEQASSSSGIARQEAPNFPKPLNINVEFDDSGKPKSCKLVTSTGSVKQDEAICASLMADQQLRSRLPPQAQSGPPSAPSALTKLLLLPAAPRGAVLTNMGEVFSSDDYPIDALRKDEQGRVLAHVTVDRAGRPTACLIAETSNSASLDAATCLLLRTRGKFKIMPDAPKRAASFLAPVRVVWTLPEEPPIPVSDYAIRTIFSIKPDQTLGGCRVEGFDNPGPTDVHCDAIRTTAQGALDHGLLGVAAITRDLVMEEGLLVGSADRADVIGRGPGRQLLRRNAWALEINPEGKVSECRPIDVSSVDKAVAATDMMCGVYRAQTFEALSAAQANRSNRHAIAYYVGYVRAATGSPVQQK